MSDPEFGTQEWFDFWIDFWGDKREECSRFMACSALRWALGQQDLWYDAALEMVPCIPALVVRAKLIDAGGRPGDE